MVKQRHGNIARRGYRRAMPRPYTMPTGPNGYLRLALLSLIICLLLPPPVLLSAQTQPRTPTLGAILTLTHGPDMTAAAWSPDGTRFLSWGGVAMAWDTATGATLYTLTAGGGIIGAAWNTSGTRILTWDGGGAARIWDASNGAELLTIRYGESVRVLGAAWSPDEARVLTWADGTLEPIRIWDAARGTEISRFGYNREIDRVVWSPDGGRIVVTGEAVHVWDARGGAPILSPPSQSGAIWSQDGLHLLTWGGGHVHLWEITTDVPMYTRIHPAVIGATWNADQSRFLTWGIDEVARLWETESGLMLQKLEASSIVWSGYWREEAVLLRLGNGHAQVWDAASGERRYEVAHDDRVMAAGWHSGHVWTLSADNSGRLWNALTGEAQFFLQHTQDVVGGHWNTVGTRLLTWSRAGTLRVFALPGTGECLVSAASNVNRRDSPSTSGAHMGTLNGGAGMFALERVVDTSGFTWWHLSDGAWVREDVVEVTGDCQTLPEVST